MKLDFDTANNIMANINGWVHGKELGLLKKLDENVQRTVQEFQHSHILGTYDDELNEPHDDLYWERMSNELTPKDLPF